MRCGILDAADILTLPRLLAICLALALASLTACGGDAVEPVVTPTHVWVLRSVNGDSLPIVFDSTSGAPIQLFDSLTIDTFTDTARDLQLAAKSSDGVGPTALVIGLKGTYSLAGDSIRIRWITECPPLCFQNRKGRIDGAVMTLTPDADISAGGLYRYQRVR